MIWGYSWGADLIDPDQDGPGSGWSDWSDVAGTGPIVLSRMGLNTFHFRTRDMAGGTTRGEIRINVVDFQPDREVLFVDDSYDGQFPTDSEHDTFWSARLQNYGTAFDEYQVHGDLDREALSPRVPDISDLNRYSLLIWENFGLGYNGESALLHAAAIQPTLRSYLLSGGKLWVGGRLSVPSMLPSPNGMQADLTYPIHEDRLGSGTFAWDFVKLRTTRINNPKGGSDPKDFLWGVAPYPGGPAVYDSMIIDPEKFGTLFIPAVPYCDAIIETIVGEDDPGFRGDIDSLYAYRAYGNEALGSTSSYHGKLNALRWHDPDPDRLHGRIQWFGFPLYYMENSQAQETFNRSLDWFREEDNTATP